jgi:hypothetical protein
MSRLNGWQRLWVVGDKARQSTTVRTFETVESAFAELDRLAGRMLEAGTPRDAIEFVVVDQDGQIVRRPNAS